MGHSVIQKVKLESTGIGTEDRDLKGLMLGSWRLSRKPGCFILAHLKFSLITFTCVKSKIIKIRTRITVTYLSFWTFLRRVVYDV